MKSFRTTGRNRRYDEPHVVKSIETTYFTNDRLRNHGYQYDCPHEFSREYQDRLELRFYDELRTRDPIARPSNYEASFVRRATSYPLVDVSRMRERFLLIFRNKMWKGFYHHFFSFYRRAICVFWWNRSSFTRYEGSSLGVEKRLFPKFVSATILVNLVNERGIVWPKIIKNVRYDYFLCLLILRAVMTLWIFLSAQFFNTVSWMFYACKFLGSIVGIWWNNLNFYFWSTLKISRSRDISLIKFNFVGWE